MPRWAQDQWVRLVRLLVGRVRPSRRGGGGGARVKWVIELAPELDDAPTPPEPEDVPWPVFR
jgi:hypothetical protein